MANNNKNTVSLWGRLGVQIDMTPEEFEILKKNDPAARDLLVDLIKSDRCSLSGESYFPPEPNKEYISEDLEFDVDFQPIQKQQPMVDALDVFIESEVPFRLEEILDVEASEEVIQELIREVKANTAVMFDYEHFDIFLMDKYEELQGLDQEAIKKLQEQISFLRDEIDGLIMLNGSEDLISMKEKQVAVLDCQLNAEKVGVKLHLSPDKIIDAEHLDCFWYDGQIGAFEYKGYTVSIEVHGDVRGTILSEDLKEEVAHFRNPSFDDACKYIKNDEELFKFIEEGRISFALNNWVEYMVFDPNGNEVSEFAYDNVLDNNVLEAFDDATWVKSNIDKIIEREANKDLQKAVALLQKYEFVDELFVVIYDYSERLNLGYSEVEAVRQRPELVEKICEEVQEYLDDEEISFEDADFSKRGFYQGVEIGEEILNIVDKIISDYKALNGLYVRQDLDDIITSCEKVSKNVKVNTPERNNMDKER